MLAKYFMPFYCSNIVAFLNTNEEHINDILLLLSVGMHTSPFGFVHRRNFVCDGALLKEAVTVTTSYSK